MKISGALSIGATMVGVVVGLAYCGSAQSQPVAAPCGPLPAMEKMLADKYQELPIGIGMLGKERRSGAQLFLSAKGTWTLIGTASSGTACFIAAGTDWEVLTPRLPAADERPL